MYKELTTKELEALVEHAENLDTAGNRELAASGKEELERREGIAGEIQLDDERYKTGEPV